MEQAARTRPDKKEAPRLIAENRRARYDYFIEERLEAGLVLQGWEVKSMRAGKAQVAEAYVYLKEARPSCLAPTSRRSRPLPLTWCRIPSAPASYC